MNNIILCNLSRGKIGRSNLSSVKPVFYLGQSSICNVYFEDLLSGGYTDSAPDGYASSLQNVDKDAATLTVKVGQRGQAPLFTQSTWANLPTTVAIDQHFANHKLVYSFSPTPVRGYFTIGVEGTATLPSGSTFPTGAAIPSITPYTHTILRDSISGRIYCDASEADIEDAIKAMFHEIVSGVAGSYVTAAAGLVGVPTGSSSFTPWDGYSLQPGTVSPSVTATEVADNEWTLAAFCPDFELQLLHIFNSYGPSLVGMPAGSSDAQKWANVIATVKGQIDLSSISITSVNLEGPHGKTGTLAFTDPAFSAALGPENEAEFWMECRLDDGTVAEGPITLKRPMP